jgi:hypothetical protein
VGLFGLAPFVRHSRPIRATDLANSQPGNRGLQSQSDESEEKAVAIWIHAWAGDLAGSPAGREPNQLLIAFSRSDDSYPEGQLVRSEMYGVPIVWGLHVDCLTPGVRRAIVTDVKMVGLTGWSAEVAQVDWGQGGAPWQPGVHLFSIALGVVGGHSAATIGTAVIDDTVLFFDQSPDPPPLAPILPGPPPAVFGHMPVPPVT